MYQVNIHTIRLCFMQGKLIIQILLRVYEKSWHIENS